MFSFVFKCLRCTSNTINFVDFRIFELHLKFHAEIFLCRHCNFIHFISNEIRTRIRCVYLLEINKSKNSYYVIKKMMEKGNLVEGKFIYYFISLSICNTMSA